MLLGRMGPVKTDLSELSERGMGESGRPVEVA